MVCKRFSPILLVFLLVACAPAPQIDPTLQVFPPSPLLPLRVAIAPPIVPVVHVEDHEALASWNESPGKRRLLMQCAWQDGLSNMVQIMIPGTEIIYLGVGKNPLHTIGSGIKAEQDSLGLVNFTLDGLSALDLARHQGWTHLVAPFEMQYSVGEKGEPLFLTTHAAIVDVLERRIVWQGVIDSRQASLKMLGRDDSKKPPLTVYEATTYQFVLDLAQVMNRQLQSNPQSRHELAQPCQDPPPLLQE